MDLAKDFLTLTQTVASIPGLSAACSLAINIITTVQKYKQNNARLQRLAHSITGHLLSIAECMQGRWDDAPAKLGDYLHDFEEALKEVLKLVTKYSKKSFVARAVGFVNADDRGMDISAAELKVADSQRSILLLMSLENSFAVRQIQNQGRAIHGTLLELVDKSRDLKLAPGPNTVEDSGLRFYTRGDLVLLGKILPLRMVYQNGKCLLKVALHEAERRSDGSTVLVKTYQGQKHYKEQTFKTNLELHTDHWDPSILQIIGASRSHETVPFEVYHLPSRQLETFGDWISHSALSNPAETILGLYDMRNSVKELFDFQRHNSVKLTRKVFRSSLVAIKPRGNRLQCSLVYAGELVTKSSVKTESPNKAFRSLRWDPLVLNNEKGPKRTLIASFTGSVNNWPEEASDLDEKINPKMSFHKLASILFQSGYLGDCGSVVHPRDNIGLGDVGYVEKDGSFVVVGNLHDQLLSVGGRPPKWEKTKLSYGSGITLKEEKVIMGRNGKIFNRSECTVSEPNPSVEVGVAYEDLDDKHAWHLLQRSACEIISRNGLSVEPHELIFVHSIEYFIYMTLKITEESPGDNLEDTLDNQGSNHASGSAQSGSDVHGSTMYIFENGDAVQVRETGAPVLAGRLRPALDAEPNWLDDDAIWRLDSGEEQSNRTKLGHTSDYMAFYIQLPPGIAIPYADQEEQASGSGT